MTVKTTTLAGSPLRARSPSSAFRASLALGFVAYLALVSALWQAVTHMTPDHLSVTLLGHTIALDDLHRRIWAKGLVVALVLPAIFAAEMAWVGWSRSSIRHFVVRRTPSSMTDLVCFMAWLTPAMTALSVIMGLGVVLLSGAWIHNRLADWTGLSLTLQPLPVPAQAVILLLFYSFFDYWSHRLDHTKYLWPLHRYHHAADDFCILNSARTHPAVFTGLVGVTLPAILLCASPDAIVDVGLFIIALRFVIHSRINSDFGWVGRCVVQSPLHHRLHHSFVARDPASHLSLLPLWDHVFGTWDGRADETLPIGVDTPYRHGPWLVPDLMRDYCDFWSGLVRRRRRSALSQLP